MKKALVLFFCTALSNFTLLLQAAQELSVQNDTTNQLINYEKKEELDGIDHNDEKNVYYRCAWANCPACYLQMPKDELCIVCRDSEEGKVRPIEDKILDRVLNEYKQHDTYDLTINVQFSPQKQDRIVLSCKAPGSTLFGAVMLETHKLLKLDCNKENINIGLLLEWQEDDTHKHYREDIPRNVLFDTIWRWELQGLFKSPKTEIHNAYIEDNICDFSRLSPGFRIRGMVEEKTKGRSTILEMLKDNTNWIGKNYIGHPSQSMKAYREENFNLLQSCSIIYSPAISLAIISGKEIFEKALGQKIG